MSPGCTTEKKREKGKKKRVKGRKREKREKERNEGTFPQDVLKMLLAEIFETIDILGEMLRI